MKNRIYEAKFMKCKEGHISIFCDDFYLSYYYENNNFKEYDLDYGYECINCDEDLCPQCYYCDYCSQECLDDISEYDDCKGCWEPKKYCMC